jgi:Ca2+-binding EF-hand superfamily protein
MFDWVKGDVDLKTRLLPFEAFLGLVIAFNTKTVGQKIDRFFKLIDDDGNGLLSYDEILNLCKRNLCTFKELDDDDDDDQFYNDLADCFAKSIFLSVGAAEDEELCAEQLRYAMTADKEKAAILEMFCGESLIDLDK